MPTGLPLDFDALLAPIAGTEQAGSSSTFAEMRSQLDDLRKEVNPDDFDADDPMRPDQPKYADWPKVEELTRKAGHDHSDTADIPVGTCGQPFEANQVNSYKDRQISAAEQLSVMNSGHLHVRPLDGVNDILLEECLDIRGC